MVHLVWRTGGEEPDGRHAGQGKVMLVTPGVKMTERFTLLRLGARGCRRWVSCIRVGGHMVHPPPDFGSQHVGIAWHPSWFVVPTGSELMH